MSISLLFISSIVFSVAGFPSCFSADQQYEKCLSPLRCGSISTVFPNITYPFWGDNIDKPIYCGRSQFQLSCEGNQNLTLDIEDLTLRVVSANLVNKTITVADESLFDGGCPKIFNFNGYDRFTLSHNTEMINLFLCDHQPINSLSNISCHPRTYYVFGTNISIGNCSKVGEIPMLKSTKNDLHQSNDPNLALKTALEKGFDLRYTIEDENCQECTNSKGICGSESGSGSFRCLCQDKPHKTSCNINDDQG